MRRVQCRLDELPVAYCSALGLPYLFAQVVENQSADCVRHAVQDEEMSSMLQFWNMGARQRPAQHIVPAAKASPLGMTVEVQEDNKSLTFLASLPGFSRDDIKVMTILPAAARVIVTVVSTRSCKSLAHKRNVL